MISRRQLIGSGMALWALAPGERLAFALDVPAPQATRIAHLVVDTRFDDALTIAQRTGAPGQGVVALPRDVLELWHDHLLPALQSSRQAIAGVTTEYSYFTLRTLAADQRLSVQLIATHGAPRDGLRDEPLVSWVIGPAASRA